MKNIIVVLNLLLASCLAHAGTGAVELVNNSSDVLSMYVQGVKGHCDATPKENCQIEIQSDVEYAVTITNTYDHDNVMATTKVTAKDGKVVVLTMTNEGR